MSLSSRPPRRQRRAPALAALLLVLLALSNKAGATTTCPPQGFDSAKDFQLEKYIAASWYVLKQMPLSYQPEDSLFCVKARYEPVNASNLEEGLMVKNYANMGRANGPSMGTSGSGQQNGSLQLLAVPAEPGSSSPSAASKLLVGPAALKRALSVFDAWRAVFGPYWVVAVGASMNESIAYDWAIVSGGPPRMRSEGACRTGGMRPEEQMNGVGLWFFARNPQDSSALANMTATASSLGYDLSVLRTVEQAGCKYEGAE